MQRKYKIIIIILVTVLFLGTFPLYVDYISGDVGGAKVLQHPFLMIKPLCSLVGGRFTTEVSGWSSRKMRYCLVKSKFICTLRGGRITTPVTEEDPYDLSQAVGYAAVGSCVKK